jgi:hypothetical protein
MLTYIYHPCKVRGAQLDIAGTAYDARGVHAWLRSCPLPPGRVEPDGFKTVQAEDRERLHYISLFPLKERSVGVARETGLRREENGMRQ